MSSEGRVASGPLALAALQELLYELITAPMGVGAGLLGRGLPSDALKDVVVGDQRLSAVERLDIYANMYFFRILDVLRDEYPRVTAAVGEDAFHDLVTDYLLTARPAHPSLREAGGRLPAYLQTHALGAERPWLPELAALERAHRELFDGPDASPLTMEALQSLPGEAFASLPIRLVPCHRLLRHAFSISRSWGESLERATAGSPVTPPEARPETVLAWRRGFGVFHRVVEDPAEWLMAGLAETGTTLGDLCEAFAEARRGTGGAQAGDTGGDEIAGEAFQILARWVDDGLLTPGEPAALRW